MLEVRDGNRVLRFDGELLAESSSYQRGQYRWVEFKLYITKSGNYILSRIGQTLLYHTPDCSIVKRNNIPIVDGSELDDMRVPCSQCDPYDDEETVALEQPRYFALVSEHPAAVLSSLYKEDRSGARYLTLVAQRLIEAAGEVDSRIDQAYRHEYIA